jgi:hypothetical protein
MATTKTSVFLPAGQKCLIGTSLGPTAGYNYPDSAMVWASQAAGWPSTDLANWNKTVALWGRTPQMIRVYQNTPEGASGVSGSTGPYGLITSDWRAIANAGAALHITIKYSQQTWAGIATNLNAVGSNATKTDFIQVALNLKRWFDDTGNTVASGRRKIIFGFHHEPSNDAQIAGKAPADYVNAHRAIFNFLRTQGVSDGPKPSSGPGSAYSGTWYDILEWCYVDIGYNMRTGTIAYYPGDQYVTWSFADIYNWAGGQVSGTIANAGHVPQPGDTVDTNHYNDRWATIADPAANAITWYRNGPVVGGVQQTRDCLLGVGEFACSEDIDRFTVSGSTLTSPKIHTGQPHKKGDWFKGVPKYVAGQAYAPGDPDNAFPASPDGTFFRALQFWNSQAAGPREWNTIPFQPGDTTAPSSTGSERTYTYDSFRTFVSDAVFTTGAAPATPPSGANFSSAARATDTLTLDFTGTVVKGTNNIASYAFVWGDGSATTTVTTAALTVSASHTYAGNGSYSVRMTVTDTAGLTTSVTHSVTANPTPSLLVSPLASAPYIQAGDLVADLRGTYNPALDALENYTAKRASTVTARTITTAYTLVAGDAGTVVESTAATAVAVTVPATTFAVGAVIEICRVGSGALTVVAASGVTFTPSGTATARAQGSSVFLRQRATNSWIVSGDLA